MFEKVKALALKTPYGAIGIGCFFLTIMIGATIGVLVIPALFALLFISPWGIVFGILDIIIRKKKLLPIISIALCGYQFFGTVFMLIGALISLFQ